MDELTYQNLLKLIQQRKVSIETHQFGARSFLKSLWLKFSCAYIRFRAIRDYECFHYVALPVMWRRPLVHKSSRREVKSKRHIINSIITFLDIPSGSHFYASALPV